jgi:hypothetical protein
MQTLRINPNDSSESAASHPPHHEGTHRQRRRQIRTESSCAQFYKLSPRASTRRQLWEAKWKQPKVAHHAIKLLSAEAARLRAIPKLNMQGPELDDAAP